MEVLATTDGAGASDTTHQQPPVRVNFKKNFMLMRNMRDDDDDDDDDDSDSDSDDSESDREDVVLAPRKQPTEAEKPARRSSRKEKPSTKKKAEAEEASSLSKKRGTTKTDKAKTKEKKETKETKKTKTKTTSAPRSSVCSERLQLAVALKESTATKVEKPPLEDASPNPEKASGDGNGDGGGEAEGKPLEVATTEIHAGEQVLPTMQRKEAAPASPLLLPQQPVAATRQRVTRRSSREEDAQNARLVGKAIEEEQKAIEQEKKAVEEEKEKEEASESAKPAPTTPRDRTVVDAVVMGPEPAQVQQEASPKKIIQRAKKRPRQEEQEEHHGADKEASQPSSSPTSHDRHKKKKTTKEIKSVVTTKRQRAISVSDESDASLRGRSNSSSHEEQDEEDGDAVSRKPRHTEARTRPQPPPRKRLKRPLPTTVIETPPKKEASMSGSLAELLRRERSSTPSRNEQQEQSEVILPPRKRPSGSTIERRSVKIKDRGPKKIASSSASASASLNDFLKTTEEKKKKKMTAAEVVAAMENKLKNKNKQIEPRARETTEPKRKRPQSSPWLERQRDGDATTVNGKKGHTEQRGDVLDANAAATERIEGDAKPPVDSEQEPVVVVVDKVSTTSRHEKPEEEEEDDEGAVADDARDGETTSTAPLATAADAAVPVDEEAAKKTSESAAAAADPLSFVIPKKRMVRTPSNGAVAATNGSASSIASDPTTTTPIPRRVRLDPRASSSAAAVAIYKDILPEATTHKKRTKNAVPPQFGPLSHSERDFMKLAKKNNSFLHAAALSSTASKQIAVSAYGCLSDRYGVVVTSSGGSSLFVEKTTRMACATRKEMKNASHASSFFGVAMEAPPLATAMARVASVSAPASQAEESKETEDGEEGEETASVPQPRLVPSYEPLVFAKREDRDFYQQKLYGTPFVPQFLRERVTLVMRHAQYIRKSTGMFFNVQRDKDEYASQLAQRFTMNKSVPRCDILPRTWQALAQGKVMQVFLHYMNKEDALLARDAFYDDHGQPLLVKGESASQPLATVPARTPSHGVSPLTSPPAMGERELGEGGGRGGRGRRRSRSRSRSPQSRRRALGPCGPPPGPSPPNGRREHGGWPPPQHPERGQDRWQQQQHERGRGRQQLTLERDTRDREREPLALAAPVEEPLWQRLSPSPPPPSRRRSRSRTRSRSRSRLLDAMEKEASQQSSTQPTHSSQATTATQDSSQDEGEIYKDENGNAAHGHEKVVELGASAAVSPRRSPPPRDHHGEATGSMGLPHRGRRSGSRSRSRGTANIHPHLHPEEYPRQNMVDPRGRDRDHRDGRRQQNSFGDEERIGRMPEQHGSQPTHSHNGHPAPTVRRGRPQSPPRHVEPWRESDRHGRDEGRRQEMVYRNHHHTTQPPNRDHRDHDNHHDRDGRGHGGRGGRGERHPPPPEPYNHHHEHPDHGQHRRDEGGRRPDHFNNQNQDQYDNHNRRRPSPNGRAYH